MALSGLLPTLATIGTLAVAHSQEIPLKNAAIPGLTMPICGLGTGGYGNMKEQPLGVYPECWTDNHPDASGKVPHPGVDCGAA